MRSRGVTGVADGSYNVSSFHMLTPFYRDLGQMRVHGFVTMQMVDLNELS
jgi:hypothetical protein